MTNIRDFEYVVLPKKAFNLVKKCLNFKSNCDFCKRKINKNCFGYISMDVVSCNSFFCLIKAVDKEEENKKVFGEVK